MTADKTFSVAVLTPTTGICRMGYTQCLVRMAMYFAQVRVFEDCQYQNLVPDSVEGSGIAENYERMVTKYLKDKEVHWTHFLSIEDDMSFPFDALHRLARHRLPIVGVNYSTNKGPTQRFTAVGLKGRMATNDDSTGLEEASLLPQGFTLVAREVYEAIPHPWFLMGYNPESGNYVYQDYYFSEQAKKAGFKLYVDHDLSKQIIHTGPKGYTYRDALTDLERTKHGDLIGSLSNAGRRNAEEQNRVSRSEESLLHHNG